MNGDPRRIELLHHIEHLDKVFISNQLLVRGCKRRRRPHDILDLPPVHLLLPKLMQLLATQPAVRKLGSRLHVRSGLRQNEERRPRARLLEERQPDLALRVRGEVVVPQRDVDARLERLVERPHAVRRQEEDAPEVLELAQEDRDHGVALQVCERALLEEDVSLVDEHDGTPPRAYSEDAGEVRVEAGRIRPKITGSYDVKRLANILQQL